MSYLLGVCLSFFVYSNLFCNTLRDVIGQRTDVLSCASLVRVHGSFRIHAGLVSWPTCLNLHRSSTYVYYPRGVRSFNTLLISLLLLLGGIHPNPGPTSTPTLTPINTLVNFGSLNVRSAISKAALIHSLISDYSLQLLALNETWTSTEDAPAILTDTAPRGYHVHHTPRPRSVPGRRGGGLAMVVSDNFISAVQQIDAPSTLFEVQCLKVTANRSPLIIINIYRPPTNAPSHAFFNEFSDYVACVCSRYAVPIVICGDFNCPGDSYSSISTHLSHTLDSFNFTHQVTSPTRNNNILDIIASNSPTLILSTSVVSSHHISDHSLVTTVMNIKKPPPPIITRTWRSLNRINYSLLDNALLKSELVTNPAVTVDDYVSSINLIVNQELDKLSPVLSRRSVQRDRPCDMFLSAEAKEAKRHRRRLERVWRRTGSEGARLEYRDACRTTNKLINDSRANFLASCIKNISNNSKNKWNQFKNLLHANNVNSFTGLGENSSIFCNRLNNFFVDKIKNLHSLTSSMLAGHAATPLSHDLPFTGVPLSTLDPVTPTEVTNLLSSLTLKFSPLDAFPSQIIKMCPLSFSAIISTLANLSFATGQFPTLYKTAQITPLLKKPNLNPDDPTNYRPISNLHTLSKILERLIMVRLSRQILSSNNFNPLQSAYRKCHSTETCLIKTLADTYKAIDEGHSTLLVALDLSAAFDTISHSTLLSRLQYSFGITGNALQWITSYLSSRTQYVAISGHMSPAIPVFSGVPQGSVLGPLLFSTYTSPISAVVSSFGLSQQQYADDTQVYFSVQNPNYHSSVSSIHACLSALCSWFTHNSLCINTSKSESILFSTPHRLRALKENGLDTVAVSDSIIPISSTIKTLGVTLDSSLTMSNHVKATVKICNFHIRAIRHVRHLLSVQDVTTIATSLVHSKLDYCNSVLSNTSVANVTSLQRVQNNLARLVLQPTSSTPALELLHDLHWLPVRYRISYKIASLTHSAIHTKQPTYINNLLQFQIPARSLRSSHKHLLNVPRCRLSLTDQSFHVAAPKLWNSLPLHLRLNVNSKIFRRELKTHLFRLSIASS